MSGQPISLDDVRKQLDALVDLAEATQVAFAQLPKPTTGSPGFSAHRRLGAALARFTDHKEPT